VFFKEVFVFNQQKELKNDNGKYGFERNPQSFGAGVVSPSPAKGNELVPQAPPKKTRPRGAGPGGNRQAGADLYPDADNQPLRQKSPH